jgi:hypothetical protein
LEDEGVSVQGLEDWWGKEEVPQQGGGICSRIVAASISASQSRRNGKNPSSRPKICWPWSIVASCRRRRWIYGAPPLPIFARFVERGLALPASDFFKGLLKYYGIKYLNLNPNGIFHVSVFVHFCEAFVGIRPHWILFQKFFPGNAAAKYQ